MPDIARFLHAVVHKIIIPLSVIWSGGSFLLKLAPKDMGKGLSSVVFVVAIVVVQNHINFHNSTSGIFLSFMYALLCLFHKSTTDSITYFVWSFKSLMCCLAMKCSSYRGEAMHQTHRACSVSLLRSVLPLLAARLIQGPRWPRLFLTIRLEVGTPQPTVL